MRLRIRLVVANQQRRESSCIVRWVTQRFQRQVKLKVIQRYRHQLHDMKRYLSTDVRLMQFPPFARLVVALYQQLAQSRQPIVRGVDGYICCLRC